MRGLQTCHGIPPDRNIDNNDNNDNINDNNNNNNGNDDNDNDTWLRQGRWRPTTFSGLYALCWGKGTRRVGKMGLGHY